MFFAYLEKLRAKPEHVRYQITLWFSALITASILLLFVGTKVLSEKEIAPAMQQENTKSVPAKEQGGTASATLTKPNDIFSTENVFDTPETAVVQEVATTTLNSTTTIDTEDF